MIPRYTRPEMAAIWSDENRFRKMLEVEILSAEAMSKMGLVPKSAVAKIRKRAKINPKRILEIEATVKHDVIAFLTQVNETIGPESRYLHKGMTSSDVLDTALGAQLKESCKMLEAGIDNLLKTIRALVIKYKKTPMMGRTHGVHAEPMTFGLKAASWYSEIKRASALIKATEEVVSFGKVSGAVGSFAHLDPKVEEYICKHMGLKPEPVSTQVVPRDRHATYLCRLAIVGASLERIATEIRHLQKTEVLEAEEPFTKGQKGSSAMPHKRNPILSENICGMARLLRSYAMAGLENIALWHERDISHSSVERVVLPDASIILDFMLVRINYLLSGLQVYPENMMKNLKKSQDIIFSGTVLLALVEKGLTREAGYALVQKAAFSAREKNVSLEDYMKSDSEILKLLNRAEITKCFDLSGHFKNIDKIYKRVLWL
ncbi:MAG TPA: adenylosuccinate lyase [Elusimicrobia bacterium]|nr:MAG: adenylosuccinate lyase [Elusimicrobia bacterium RIFOXYA12_FULL_49_49]OGS09908.1 MAG: adenylosuccinate lyase [Elusimicrobia bacterium RIFOXYA1_FULL_47_7]OGS10013.1 MAG: adenylosuccinate lyase [Elusimicrobia bacterium RIFOXYB1_FULL_48_9]OGS15484.1 MAG: adenylosuccinate lyase [Elusimicrobia bacterium RIFOXYA2_FULL_47_53]OGS26979.1 MAG: adenylosuccinate lyase [Elusimicrobia bacterium RIFOXYB12_FULL_50_12]OGS30924.1 MAG: adenylosuccinate lyase [Elusimicrobia bacterium RIFOXYB2_FULL_46_23]H